MTIHESDIVSAHQEKQAILMILRERLKEEPTISELVRICASQFADDPLFIDLPSVDLASEIVTYILTVIQEVRTPVFFKLRDEALETIQEIRGEESFPTQTEEQKSLR